VTLRPKTETITPPKEAAVPNKMTPKERCLALLTRNGSASPSLMMQRCHIASEELKAIVAAGEIKAWPYRGARQRMTAIYTLPDAKDPRTKEMLEGMAAAKEKKAAVAPATPRVARATAPVVKPSPSNGSGSIAAAIADLERRRSAALDTVERINTAIETLRALA
jgi:hypothetical protein